MCIWWQHIWNQTPAQISQTSIILLLFGMGFAPAKTSKKWLAWHWSTSPKPGIRDEWWVPFQLSIMFIKTRSSWQGRWVVLPMRCISWHRSSHATPKGKVATPCFDTAFGVEPHQPPSKERCNDSNVDIWHCMVTGQLMQGQMLVFLAPGLRKVIC